MAIPTRKTFSAYLDEGVVDALDTLVKLRRFANRSDALEEACRRLIVDELRESIAGDDPAEAVTA